MTPNAKKQAAFKARKRAEGLAEVRGIWAPPADHERIRAMVKQVSNDPATTRADARLHTQV